MMRDALQDIINENPLSTIKEINAALQSRFPEKPVISDSCVGSVLDKMLITLKIARDVPAQRNSDDVINQRLDYAKWYLETGQLRETIFIDECGCHVWTKRTYGRAAKGYRTVAKQ